LLTQLVEPSLSMVNAGNYIKSGILRAFTTVEAVDNISSSMIDEIKSFCGKLSDCAKELEEHFKIGISQTHGDFQPANVLKTKTDAGWTIIDWESTLIRTASYDFFTWEFDTRHNLNFSDNILFSLTDATFEEKVKKNLGIDWEKNKREICLCFIIDEFNYRIDESCDNLFYQSGGGLEKNIRELSIVLNYFQTNKIS